MENKNKKNHKIKKRILFTEIFIWFLIFIFAFLVINKVHLHNKDSYRTYQIFLQDIDGIIVGSPVRMMGINVGYVKKIKILNDTIFVEFILTKKNMVLPKGSYVTVEFNGLGGSKSIEIYPPTQKPLDSTPTLIVMSPKRIGDALNLLNTMFDKVISIVYKCSNFANSLQQNNIYSETFDINIETNKENEFLDNLNKKMDEIQHKRYKKKIK